MYGDSITKIGVVFIIYLFITIISFFVVSSFATPIFDAFDNADFSNAEDELNSNLPIYRTAFSLAVAIFLSIPITWFIMKIFSREPNYNYYRRR